MKKKKTAALALAAVLGCGILAGCNLVTTDAGKDFAQVIATVDISTESQYSEENIRDMLARVFRTETGRELLKGIYLNQERNYHGQK